ncbi:Uncharacterised protein [Serratia fonticola]|nr:Uncharacterised protein [Serratia fonticola]
MVKSPAYKAGDIKLRPNIMIPYECIIASI